MIESYEVIALISCLCFSAFFSGSESAILSLGVDRTRQLIAEGGQKARVMKFMAEHPTDILTTILVGNNIVNILAASLTTSIMARIFANDVVTITTFVVTVVILIFGEISPKVVGRAKSEKLAYPALMILRALYYIGYPVIKILSGFITKVLGSNAQIRGRITTMDDIEYVINKAEKEQTLDSKQIDLLTSILEFPTIKVKDIMVPRSKVKFIEASKSFEDIITATKEEKHSRYPVCEGTIDEPVGFLHIKDLSFIRDADELSKFDVTKYLKPVFFVYEHMKIQAVFDHMNRKKVHLALVKDENGIIVGMITLEDIVEEILGEIHDEHDIDIEDIHDNYEKEDLSTGILVDGTISVRDLYNDFDIRVPLNDNYSTLAGFLLDMLGNNFPDKGQLIIWEGYSFELTRVDDYEIREVCIKTSGNDKSREE